MLPQRPANYNSEVWSNAAVGSQYGVSSVECDAVTARRVFCNTLPSRVEHPMLLWDTISQ